jgi:hypothetical protein
MPLPAKLGMGDDILEESVSASGPEKVGGNDEHTGRRNGTPRFGDEDGNSFVSHRLRPYAFGSTERLRNGTDLWSPKKSEQPREIRCPRKPCFGHPDALLPAATSLR